MQILGLRYAEFRDMVEEFEAQGKSEEFSKDGLYEIYNFNEEITQACSAERDWVLDVPETCLKWKEYATINDLAEDYGVEGGQDIDEVLDMVEEQTIVIALNNNGYLVMGE